MRSRHVLTVAVAALAAAVANTPAVAFADSGPSAGDNQYLDPLASSTTPASKPKTATTPTSTGTATATTTPASTSAPPAAGTATTAAPTATTSGASSRALPYTGYEAWLVIGVGAGIAGAGVAIRRRGLDSR